MKPTVSVLIPAVVLGGALLLVNLAAAQQHEHQVPQQAPTIKLTTDLVSLNVMVTDPIGRAITGLKKENFKVYEDKVEQPISFFSADEAPVSWGLVLDRSGSMMEMMQDVYRAALHVVDEGTERDETFIVTFNKRVELACDFMSDRHKLENSLLGLRAEGETALWDAVAYGLDRIKQGKHPKKVLVVVTDGEDNASGLSFRRLIDRVEEEEVLIYPVGMFERAGTRELLGLRNNWAQTELEKLAEATGGRAHFPANVEQCTEAMKEIAREVSQQYSLGYYPTNTARDGKWRRVQVVAAQEQTKSTYVARARAGYYAPGTGGPR